MIHRICFCLILFYFLASAPLLCAQELIPLSHEQEKLYQNIGKQVKCVVCAHQSVYDSSIPMAQALKQYIRQSVSQGKTQDQIFDDLKQIYGNQILFEPPMNMSTYLLWGLPFVLGLAGVIFMFIFFNKNKGAKI